LLGDDQGQIVANSATRIVSDVENKILQESLGKGAAQDYALAFVTGFNQGRAALKRAICERPETWLEEKKFLVGKGKKAGERETKPSKAYPAYQLWIRANAVGWVSDQKLRNLVPHLTAKGATVGRS
jgi:hypothetical protein